jgi:hypothetical protein
VVVAVGLTVREPVAATVPMPWSIDTVVAFAVDHDSVALSPAAIEVGAAVRLAVGSDGAAVDPETVTPSKFAAATFVVLWLVTASPT